MRSKYLILLSFLFATLFSSQAARAILPIQHWQTSNGARVYFVENRDIPMIDLSIDFAAGNAYDAAARKGVASMTNRIMRLGAEGMDEEEIARRMADIGVSVAGRFDGDSAGLGMRTLSSRAELEQAMDVFTRVLQQPTFPAPVLEREKKRLVSSLKESEIQPGAIVARTFNQLLYGEHPYGFRSSGDVESVMTITRDDLLRFYKRHYVARDAVIAIIGDLTRAEAGAMAERLAVKLPVLPVADAVPAVAPINPRAETITRLLPHHATQSHILVGTLGMSRDDPDYFPLLVGNHVLGGGGFSSRISEEVRQKRGLAYSAYSYFSPRVQKGAFAIGMQTRKDQAKEALDVTMKTLRDFIATGPTAKELDDAKKNLIGGFPLRIDSNRKIHEYLALIGFYKLPLNYLDEFVGKVERVTLADIKRTFAARIDPDKLVTVVVGADEPAETVPTAAR